MVPEELIAEARSVAELDDFGPNDYRDGLEHYCESVNAEARLNELGETAIRANIVGSLVNRARIVDWARSHPEVADERVETPLVVIGMFRAGTTFLSYLLELDARNRALLRWEAGDSIPPPTAATLHAGPRVDAARIGNDMLEQINPRIRAIHHEEPDGPTECIALMSQDFKSLSWEAISNVPGYGRWLLGVDQRSAYEYHRLALGVLQSGGVRGRWTLKSPHHALNLGALTAVYPDARLVLLHRDPTVLCASVCSLIHTLSSTFSDADHRSYIAEHWVAMLEESIRRIDAFRATHPEHEIVDVQYEDLVHDPVATVGRIAVAVGDGELAESTTNAMERYVVAHPKGGLGAHEYELGEFGLDADDLAARFAGYVERYGIPTERRRRDRALRVRAGRRRVDRRALLVRLPQQPKAQELRERVPQEDEPARDADGEARDREGNVGAGVEHVDVRSRGRGDIQRRRVGPEREHDPTDHHRDAEELEHSLDAGPSGLQLHVGDLRPELRGAIGGFARHAVSLIHLGMRSTTRIRSRPVSRNW